MSHTGRWVYRAELGECQHNVMRDLMLERTQFAVADIIKFLDDLV